MPIGVVIQPVEVIQIVWKNPVDTIQPVLILTPSTFRRRCWLALFAMLAAALLPTFSHAIHAAHGGQGWVEVCTGQGIRLVALGEALGVEQSADPGSSEPQTTHLDSCLYCGCSPVMGLPPSTAGPAWMARLAAFEPPLFLHAAHTLFAWRTAQPRGPPSFS